MQNKLIRQACQIRELQSTNKAIDKWPKINQILFNNQKHNNILNITATHIKCRRHHFKKTKYFHHINLLKAPNLYTSRSDNNLLMIGQ